jgi:hypothetical protein
MRACELAGKKPKNPEQKFKNSTPHAKIKAVFFHACAREMGI